MTNEIAFRIKKIREFRNYTQAYMAGQLGICQNTYSKIESGHIRVKTNRLEKIAAILNVPCHDILNGDLQLNSVAVHRDTNNDSNLRTAIDTIVELLRNEIHSIREQNIALHKLLDLQSNSGMGKMAKGRSTKLKK